MIIKSNNAIIFESPSEEIISSDNNYSALDKDLYEPLYALVPDSLKLSNDYFNEFFKLCAEVITREILISYDINNIFDADRGSSSVLEFLASRYDIIFPYNYPEECKRLVLKYYPNFIKNRGTNDLIKILDFIGRSEKEFYESESHIDKYEVQQIYEGYIEITVPNDDKTRILEYINLAQNLLNNLTPAGMYIKLIFKGGE